MTRSEDGPFLTGAAHYVADLELDGVLHMAVVRSPVAAGRILNIDSDASLRVPGVKAVLTGEDVALPGLKSTSKRPEFTDIVLPILACGVVRHVGEPVGVVLAASPAAAQEGTDLLEVDYDPYEAVTTVDDAMRSNARTVNDGTNSNILLDISQWKDPTLSQLFDDAHLVVEEVFECGRLAPAPIETRGCLAHWESQQRRLVVHSSTQVPFVLRMAIAGQMQLPESHVRVMAPSVGGGFGLKAYVSREEILTAYLARHLRHPVKWVESRYENLTAGLHAPEQRYRLKVAFDAEGHLLGLEADILVDVGAYSAYPFGYALHCMQAASDMPGPYKVPRYRSRARAVATNKCPTGAYRGVARTHVTTSVERMMDIGAARLGLDRLDIRRRNLIETADFPYEGITGLTYDQGSYRESLDLCASALDYAKWDDIKGSARDRGRLLGLGFACFNEHTGFGSPVFSRRGISITVAGEVADVRMDATGYVEVRVGVSSQGQGHQTTLAQIAADELQISPDRIRVLEGDTDLTAVGWGTFASRSISVAGGAVKLAAERLAGHIKTIAAHLLEASIEDMQLLEGRVVLRGDPCVGYELSELAHIAHYRVDLLPELSEPGLHVSANFDPPGTFSNATHGALVEVSVDTGEVTVLRFVVVEDCGTVINPRIVDGQTRGGVVQGIASALYEEILYDSAGNPLISALVDYCMPSAPDVPQIEIKHIETPSPTTATGAKGMGESGVIGTPGAILNAINDAIGVTGGVINSIPATPMRVSAAIRNIR